MFDWFASPVAVGSLMAAASTLPCLALAFYMHRRDALARRLEETVRSLYALSVEAGNAASVNNVIAAIEYRLEIALQASIQVILRHETPPIAWQSIMQAAIASRKATGRFTDTFIDAPILCMPMYTQNHSIGVLIVSDFLSSFVRNKTVKRRLLHVLSAHAAVCIEKTQLAEQKKEQQIHVARDQVLAAVVSSLSHDLKTPLAGIISTVASVKELPNEAADQRNALLAGAETAARQLDIFLDNLMILTRIENGMLAETPEPLLLDDAFATVLQTLRTQTAGRSVRFEIAPNVPLLRMNAALLHSVLQNVCQNAYKYAPNGKMLIMRAFVDSEFLYIEIEDDGQGIAADKREDVFQKFCRLERGDRGPTGAGLGLYICRTLMRAHGGDMMVTQGTVLGGACFVMSIPLHHTQELPPMLDEDDMPQFNA